MAANWPNLHPAPPPIGSEKARLTNPGNFWSNAAFINCFAHLAPKMHPEAFGFSSGYAAGLATADDASATNFSASNFSQLPSVVSRYTRAKSGFPICVAESLNT